MKRNNANEPKQGTDKPSHAQPKRSRFASLELAHPDRDPADAVEEEIPGAAGRVDVRPGVEPLVLLEDTPFLPTCTTAHTGRGETAYNASVVRVEKSLIRDRVEESRQFKDLSAAGERYDQPAERYNDAGDPIEPFHLKRELDEGLYVPETGAYIPFAEREDVEERDEWVEQLVESAVAGVAEAGPGPAQDVNEPVEEPKPLPAEALLEYKRRLVLLMHPQETVADSLRRLGGAGPALSKFRNREEGERMYHQRMKSGHTVAVGNQAVFDNMTEAAEILMDHGMLDVYDTHCETLQRQLRECETAELSPMEATLMSKDSDVVRRLLYGEIPKEDSDTLTLATPTTEHGHDVRQRLQQEVPVPAAPSAADEPNIISFGQETGTAGIIASDAVTATQDLASIEAKEAIDIALGMLGAGPTQVAQERTLTKE